MPLLRASQFQQSHCLPGEWRLKARIEGFLNRVRAKLLPQTCCCKAKWYSAVRLQDESCGIVSSQLADTLLQGGTRAAGASLHGLRKIDTK